MVQLTKSMPIVKERTCTASMVLDMRTNRKNVSEFPLAVCFTIGRKLFYIIKLVVLIQRRNFQISAMLQRVHPTIIAYKKNGEVETATASIQEAKTNWMNQQRKQMRLLKPLIVLLPK